MLHRFRHSIASFSLPTRLNNPFHYTPHPLCELAARELQAYLCERKEWTEELSAGKMFGVLVVKDSAGTVGFLTAFSGNLAGSNSHEYFVPPIYDMLRPGDLFRTEEAAISDLNRQIETLETDVRYRGLLRTIEETETEAGITIFLRSRTGITLTKDGAEFLGYARQVIQQMELLEDRYVTNLPGKVTFGVSSQHYTFTENAFVELVKRFGQERYAFYYNETGTHQILDDVKNRVCDLGILYLSHENEVVMRKVIEENHLVFTELFAAKPHVFLQKDHPLASKKVVSAHDLVPYPRLNFVQGEYESVYFSEELFSSIPVDKEIRVNDRGAIVNFMLGLNAYTISSGIFPKYLNGENIISVPLAENETMHIGYVLNENQELSELGKSYLEELRKYAPANP